MSNTQTISNQGCLPGYFTDNNISKIQKEISKRISLFYSSKTVIIPRDNIVGVMIHVHEHWGKRTMSIEQLNETVIHDLAQEFKNHLYHQRTSNYYLNNEYSLNRNAQNKSLNTYKMNPRARGVQFQKTF